MKRLKTFLLVLISVCGNLPAIGQNYVEIDGIAYETWYNGARDNRVRLRHDAYIVKRKDGKPYSGDLVIPQYVVYDGDDVNDLHHGDSIIVKFIADAFEGAEIVSLSLPPSIVSINYSNAFGNCKYLKALELPGGFVGEIYSGMFYGCESLESLKLPSTFEKWDGGAFRNCPNLKKVTVASNHPKYDSRDDCNAVVETATNTLLSASAGTVSIPNTIDSIGRSAFEGLTIDSIHIPENVKFIDSPGYFGVANISAKSISVKDMETWCNLKTRFYFFKDDLEYDRPLVGLPLSYENLYFGDKLVRDTLIILDNVKRVANFFANRYLKSVSIPSSVEEIASYAFFGCDSLAEVHIADGTKTIGEAAFACCSSLTSLSLPSTLQSIGKGAFGGCSKIISLSLPASLEQIGEGAFASCSKLEVVLLKAAQPPVTSAEMFDPAVYENTPLIVPKGTKSLYGEAEGWKRFKTIVDNVDDMDNFHLTFEADGYLYHVIDANKKEVEMIPEYAIENDWTTAADNSRYHGDIVIPETVVDGEITYTVTRLGYNLFEPYNKEHLVYNIETDITSVHIPKSIKEIHTEFAHYDIYVEDLAAWCNIDFTDPYGELPDPKYTLPQNLYVNNQLVTDLVIPDGVTHIGDAAFMGFHGIKSLTLPASVVSIGKKAFCRSKLEKVTIPATVKQIGLAAFEGDNEMTSLTISEGVAEISPAAFADCLSLTKVSIPSSVKTIGNFAFRWCDSMEELTIANGVENIGEWAFFQCEKIKNVSVPSSVKTIGRSAFTACKNLKTVNLVEGLESIDRYAFENCTSLESLHIPASVKYIGRNVVEDCHNLKTLSVATDNSIYNSRDGSNMIFDNETNTIIAAGLDAEIPNDIDEIGDYAFAYFSDRQSFIIPNGIKTIGNSAFLHCWSLHTITIPESVAYIGHNTFDSCDGLKEVIALASDPCKIEDDAFFVNNYKNANLYVPDNAVDSYREAEGWKKFEHIEGHSVMSINTPPILDYSEGEIMFKTDGQRVLLDNLNAGDNIIVYTLGGSMVKKVKAAPDGKAILVLPTNGIYVIRTQKGTIKVNIR